MAGGLSQTLRLVVKGDAKGAVGALRGLDRGLTKSGRTGGTFGHMLRKGALLAAAGFAFMVAGLYIVIRVLRNVMRKSIEWMGGMIKLQRITGLGAKALSLLAGQFRLSGVLADKAVTGVRFFQKNLQAARLGVTAQVDAFKALHVSLKDSNGQWINGADLLQKVRDRFSKMIDVTKRTYLAVKLFGKGGADMLPWLMKSRDVMAGYTKDLKQFGMFTQKDLETYKKFMGNQRLMSYMWDMLRVKAGLLAMTLMNKVFPALKELYAKYSPKVQAALKAAFAWIATHGDTFKAVLSRISQVLSFIAKHAVAVGAAFVGWKISKGVLPVLAAIRAAFVFTSAAAVTATTSVAAASVAVQATTRAFGYTVPILGQTAVATERVAASTAVATRRFALLSGGLGAVAIRLGVVAAAGYGVYKAIEDITTTGGWKQFTDFLKNPFSDQGKKDFDALLARVAKLKALEKSLAIKPKLDASDVQAKLKKMAGLVHIFGAKIPKDFMASLAGLPGAVSKISAAAANKFMLAWAEKPAWAKKIGLALATNLALGIAAGQPQAENAAAQLMAGVQSHMVWHGRTPWQGFDYGEASGGDYVVNKPTLFLAGEAGRERATFTPGGGRPAAAAGGGIGPITIPIFLDGRQIAAYTVDLMTRSATRLARGYS
jgi:hypothetical protein